MVLNAVLARGRLADRSGFGRALTGLLRERLVQPIILFATGDDERRAIPSLPGQYFLSVTEAVRESRAAARAGIAGVLLLVAPDRHDESALIAAQRDWLVPRAIRAIKDAVPDLGLATEVCVCAYTSHAQCVLFREGVPDLSATHARLGEIAVAHAESGADLVLLTGMLEGSVRAVRRAVEEAGVDAAVGGAVKYASALHAADDAAVGVRPYRERAVPLLEQGDLAGALRVAEADAAAGADLIVVSPGLSALDVAAAVRARLSVPMAVFQPAGEYALAQSLSEQVVLERPALLLESARATRRAGADLLFTYAALETAALLEDDAS
jgi:porphobilinogen synthase